MEMDFNKISGWSSIIGIPLAVFLSWVFFELGQEEQDPIFLEDHQARTVIVDKQNASQAPITILDEESNPVEGNVISTKFYFWNNGKKPILFDEDVLERADTGEKEILVSVHSSEEEARILKYDCPVKINQEYTGFTVSQAYKNAISIRFNVMRRSEGVTCSLVFEGDTFSILTIQGSLLDKAQGFSQGASFSKLKWAVVEENLTKSLHVILSLFIMYLFLFRALTFAVKTLNLKSFNWNLLWHKNDWLEGLAVAAVLSLFLGALGFFWESRIVFREYGFISPEDLAVPAELLNQNP